MSRNCDRAPSTHISAGLEALVAVTGALLLAGALLATQSWWDRHFLPLFFFPHDDYILGERLARLAAGMTGLGLIFFIRPIVGRVTSRMSVSETAAACLRLGLAVGLALGTAEWMMGHNFTHAAAEAQPGEEPPRQPHPRLGWVFTPAHDGRTIAGDREIAYSIDRLGYRVPSQGTPVDVNLPTLVFTGESIIAGYGLNWEETIPAQVGAALNIQSANIAVFGYANDQAYLRLQSELPRFRQPRAVVSLFIPSLFARNLGDDRPHQGPGLAWKPAVHRLWLSSLLRFLLPYHSETQIEQGIQNTSAQLMATTELARRHGAIPLVVDPQFGPETPVERMLRRRILDEPGIDYVRVKLDPSWHLKDDLHPDPRATHAIAMAIAARLKTDMRTDLARQAGALPLDPASRSNDDGAGN